MKIYYFFLFISVITFAQNAPQTYDLTNMRMSNDYSFVERNNELWMFGNVDEELYSHYDVLKSTDGENWTLVGRDVLNAWSKTVFFKGKYYSIGGNIGGMTNEIKTSTDGITWTVAAVPPFPARRRHQVLVHNKKLFVIAGAGHNDVWYTENGSTWIQATNALSTDFPHFWDQKVVSLNGKLILFGGHKTDWAFIDNERGVYVSENDGANWTRNEFPFEANLDRVSSSFIYDNKLWLVVKIHPYAGTDGNHLIKEEDRLFSTTDGVNWVKEANPLNPVVVNDGVLTNVTTFNNEIISYTKNTVISKVSFDKPPFQVPSINGQFIRQSATNSATIVPFDVKNLDGSDGVFDYDFEVENPRIISCAGFSVENGELHINPSGVVGETKVIVHISNGFESYKEQFQLFIFPDAEVFIRPKENVLLAQGESLNTTLLFREELAGFGTNTYTLTSSNETFIPSSDINVTPLSILEYFNISNVDGNTLGESKITIQASDGTNSFTREFWLKVGEDEAPISNGTLADYDWDSTMEFDYTLPNSAFTDPEGVGLTYSSDNIPCGLILDENTGMISGHTFETIPFDINIIATDRYGKTTNHTLHVVDTINALDVEETNLTNAIIKMYPNPSNDFVTIETNSNQQTNVFIYNSIGQLMLQKSFSKEKETIPHGLKTGIYYLQVINENKNVTKTLLIK